VNREEEQLGEFLAEEAQRVSTLGLNDAIYMHDYPIIATNRGHIESDSPRLSYKKESGAEKLITIDSIPRNPPRRPSDVDSLGETMLLTNHQSI